MKCNAYRLELEGRAVSTTCGHILCTEDASKIISSDAACPVCDQMLSKSLMKPVEINSNYEWINMATAGISPQIYQLVFTPATPGRREDMWPSTKQNSNSGPFDVSDSSPAKPANISGASGNEGSAHPLFGTWKLPKQPCNDFMKSCNFTNEKTSTLL